MKDIKLKRKYFNDNSFYFHELGISDEIKSDILFSLKHNAPITKKSLDCVAELLLHKAINGFDCTHYTHWFNPYTNVGAEKHDSFWNGADIQFTGDELYRQETDGSSFPSGELRNTANAKAFTYWDPTSPFFIKDSVLYIPARLETMTGLAMDFKTPLLNSERELNNAGIIFSEFFGETTSEVLPTLGWEQEFFLFDKSKIINSPEYHYLGKLEKMDITKGQKLEDHYFSPLPKKVLAFMRELEIECLKVGIPIKTRHSEVAPNQYEMAPHFSVTNVSVDQNLLFKQLSTEVADRHDLVILLSEKPSPDLNGSGKHLNWSLKSDNGNLFKMGKTKLDKLKFLLIMSTFIRQVNSYSDLLTSTIVSYGNKHRLGGNEAPPAAITIHLGEQLTDIFENIKNINLDDINIDETSIDRNRTSALPFIGNRFEFRAAGSSQTPAFPILVLNTLMVNGLKQLNSDLSKILGSGGIINDSEDVINKIKDIIEKYWLEAKDVVFNGDGYKENSQLYFNVKKLNHDLKLEYIAEAKNINLFLDNNIYKNQDEVYSVFICLTHILKELTDFSNKISIRTNRTLMTDEVNLFQKVS